MTGNVGGVRSRSRCKSHSCSSKSPDARRARSAAVKRGRSVHSASKTRGRCRVRSRSVRQKRPVNGGRSSSRISRSRSGRRDRSRKASHSRCRHGKRSGRSRTRSGKKGFSRMRSRSRRSRSRGGKKRPLNSFMRFMKTFRAKNKSKYPDVKKLASAAGAAWRKMSPAEKSKYRKSRR